MDLIELCAYERYVYAAEVTNKKKNITNDKPANNNQ